MGLTEHLVLKFMGLDGKVEAQQELPLTVFLKLEVRYHLVLVLLPQVMHIMISQRVSNNLLLMLMQRLVQQG